MHRGSRTRAVLDCLETANTSPSMLRKSSIPCAIIYYSTDVKAVKRPTTPTQATNLHAGDRILGDWIGRRARQVFSMQYVFRQKKKWKKPRGPRYREKKGNPLCCCDPSFAVPNPPQSQAKGR